jgi:hypothetical protein
MRCLKPHREVTALILGLSFVISATGISIGEVIAQPALDSQSDNLPAKGDPLRVIDNPTIEEALGKVVDLDFKDTPLDKVVEDLRNRTGVRFVLAKQVLADSAVSTDTPVSFRCQGLKLRLGLDLMLDEMALTWMVRDGAIFFTTAEDAEEKGPVRVYLIADLVDRDAASGEPRGIDPDRLIRLITTSIAPDSWEDVGGEGGIDSLASDRVVVRQTLHVHWQLAEILRLLRRLRHDHSTATTEIKVPVLAFKEDMTLDRRPDLRVSLDYKDTPLESVLESFAAQIKVPIRFDQKQMAEVAFDPATRVSIQVKELAPKQAFSLLLDDVKLTWRDAGQAIVITSPQDCESRPSIRVYPVFDLIPRQSDLERRYGHDALEELIDAITTTIAPESWDEVGGSGTMESVSPWPALVVSQTPEVHDGITDMLARLRATGVPLAGGSPPFDPSKPIRMTFSLTKEDIQETFTSGTTQTVRKSRTSARTADEIVKQLRIALPTDQWDENSRMISIDDKIVIEAPPALVAKVEDLLNELRLIEHGEFGGGSGIGPWPGIGPGAFRD